jgi:hypothetical protein
MSIPEVLASLSSLIAQPVTIESFLHSDTVNVWLNEQPWSEDGQVIVNDARIAKLLLSSLPPRVGGVFAYCLESTISGVLSYDETHKRPALEKIERLVVKFRGSEQRLL